MPTLLRASKLFAAALALPMMLAACAGTDSFSGDDLGQEDDALTESASDKTAFDFFLAKGLTPVQAAGVIGNLDQESSMSPTVSQYGGGPGRGIAQWSAGGRWDHDYHDNVAWYAGVKGESKYALHLQLEFIWYELTTYGYGYSQLKAATTVSAATAAFQDHYEICGTCDASNRIAHANAALAQFGHDGGGSTSGGGTSGGGCVAGGYYCGGDKVSGDHDNLYKCTSGTHGTLVEACGNGCQVNSGDDDACRSGGSCYPGGFYCGGDEVNGDPDTLYKCTSGSHGTVVKHCASGCKINPGDDDSCK